MRMTLRILGTLAIAAALSVGVSAAQEKKAAAAKTLSVTGVVTSVSPGSLAIEAGGKKAMTFTIDKSTRLLARGSTAKTKEKKEQGAPGLQITDMVKAGQQVTVRYTTTGSTMLATQVSVTSR
jgi:hypothetical protein